MRFEHVDDDALDGYAPDGLLEEHVLDGLRGDGTQSRQHEQRLAESEWLTWVGGRVVLAQRHLGLLLEGHDARQVFEEA